MASRTITVGAPINAGDYQTRDEKGDPGGYASLDWTGVVPDGQIPAGVARDSEVATALSGKQPLDSDLTEISALSTTVFGRGLLELSNAAGLLSAAGGAAASHSHVVGDVTGLEAALGGGVLYVVAAIADSLDSIVFTDPAPDDADAVLVWGRSAGNGVYSMSTVDGWDLLDPQPSTVVAGVVYDWSDMGTSVFDSYVFAMFVVADNGWEIVGVLPSAGGNPASVWGATGWRTVPASTFTYFTDGAGGYDVVGGPYVEGSARIFIGPDDPEGAGFTMHDGDQWTAT